MVNKDLEWILSSCERTSKNQTFQGFGLPLFVVYFSSVYFCLKNNREEMSWKLLNELWSLPWRDFARDARNFTYTGVKFFCYLHVLNRHVCGIGLPVGPSMLPTFNLSGDILLVERFSPTFGKIKHGDIVIVTSPEDPRKDVIKRVTGMEGDCVESFRMKNKENQCVEVPKGHVWLLGDNLTVSNDSREYGPVPYAHIRGKIFLRIWPIGGFGIPK